MEREFREWLSYYRLTPEWKKLTPDQALVLEVMGLRGLRDGSGLGFETQAKKKWDAFLRRPQQSRRAAKSAH